VEAIGAGGPLYTQFLAPVDRIYFWFAGFEPDSPFKTLNRRVMVVCCLISAFIFSMTVTKWHSLISVLQYIKHQKLQCAARNYDMQ